MPVVLDAEKHIYTNTDNGKIYDSVTTYISSLKKKFDIETHSKRVAAKRGVDQSVILDEWKEKTVAGCERGTQHHLIMEEYIKNKIIPKGFESIVESFYKKTKFIIKNDTIVNSEMLLYSHELELAGTADLIIENGNTFVVQDFKTNKRFNFTSNYNDWFYEPINHLPVCEFTTYTIQLSIYAYLYEQISGKKCTGMSIFYLREFNDKKFFQEINCMYAKDTVISLFDDRLSKIKLIK